MEVQNPPKRHHYLPCKLLEGFGRREQDRCFIWWFNRARGEFRCEQPKNTAIIKDFYTFETPAGSDRDHIENALADIEGQTWPWIARLESGDELTSEGRGILALFIALLIRRTPEFDSTLKTMVDLTRKSMVEKGWVDEAPPEWKHTRNLTLKALMEGPRQLMPLIGSFDWKVIHAPLDMPFILTDAPFIKLPPPGYNPRRGRGYGIATTGTTKILPLSAKIALVMTEPNGRFRHKSVREGTVRSINLHLAVRSFDYVFARDELLLRSIVKRSRVDQGTSGPRIAVG